MDDISKERFEGTVLKAISKNIKKIKMEPKEQLGGGGGGAEAGQTLLGQVQKILENSWNHGKVLESDILFSRREDVKITFVFTNQFFFFQLKIKVEKTDEENEGVKGKPEADGGEEVKLEVKKEEEEVMMKNQSADTGGGAAAGGRASTAPEMGRLVMTIDGQQKQLSFCTNDLLTTATMLDGDKVRGSDVTGSQVI